MNYELGIKNILEVDNIFGENVYTTPLIFFQGGDFEIGLTNEPSGIYLYRVIDETGKAIANGKFVIEK